MSAIAIGPPSTVVAHLDLLSLQVECVRGELIETRGVRGLVCLLNGKTSRGEHNFLPGFLMAEDVTDQQLNAMYVAPSDWQAIQSQVQSFNPATHSLILVTTVEDLDGYAGVTLWTLRHRAKEADLVYPSPADVHQA